MTSPKLKAGDRVLYVGKLYECYWGLSLTIHSAQQDCIACTFPDPDRPGGLSITTWLAPKDLIPEEVTV